MLRLFLSLLDLNALCLAAADVAQLEAVLHSILPKRRAELLELARFKDLLFASQRACSLRLVLCLRAFTCACVRVLVKLRELSESKDVDRVVLLQFLFSKSVTSLWLFAQLMVLLSAVRWPIRRLTACSAGSWTTTCAGSTVRSSRVLFSVFICLVLCVVCCSAHSEAEVFEMFTRGALFCLIDADQDRVRSVPARRGQNSHSERSALLQLILSS